MHTYICKQVPTTSEGVSLEADIINASPQRNFLNGRYVGAGHWLPWHLVISAQQPQPCPKTTSSPAEKRKIREFSDQ